MQPPAPPSHASGYTIREELTHLPGQLLLRATRISDGAPVLIRRPSPWAGAGADGAWLRREAEIFQQLAGPGVPRVLALDPPDLIFEDIGAGPLTARVARGPLAIPDFLLVARALVTLVARIHDQGFILRGLRSDRVFVTPDLARVVLLEVGTVTRLAEAATLPPGLRGPRPARDILSPEQTGRMNRLVDHRSDLYALGAIFYQLLTGRPPFATSDPLELSHWHIARAPLAPAALNPDVPAPLSDLVLKLLSKMAEDRYQSAPGIEADLEAFAAHRRGDGTPTDFALAASDAPLRLIIPQRLFGRAAELAALAAASDAAAGGTPVFAFVAGYAGAGKTALVNEARRTIEGQGKRFAAGKFDQNEQATPYAALTEALAGLGGQIAAQPPELRAALGEELRAALGGNCGVLAALVPELDALVAPHTRVRPLGPLETQNRLVLALASFLAASARHLGSLVIFLDDLQWADTASLRILAHTVTRLSGTAILFVGAFRDGDVSPDHPLNGFRSDLRQRGVTTVDVTLAPLGLPHLVALVKEALGKDDAGALPLARLLAQKTDGNPFFVIQFLKSLEAQGVLRFDRATRAWEIDLPRAEAAASTENVVELMRRKLRHLGAAARDALTAASCIGNRFSLATLALLRGQAPEATAADLWDAILEGFVVPSSSDYEIAINREPIDAAAIEYRFSHDRVQQAAYDLIAADRRAQVHLGVARLLHAGQGEAATPAALFEIASHYNLAAAAITDPQERRRAAELDLAAGRRARAGGAFQGALDLFHKAHGLIEGSPAENDRLGWSLAVETAECELACGQVERATARLEAVIAHAPHAELKAEAFRIRIVNAENTGHYADAVTIGLAALERFGVQIPASSSERAAALAAELAAIDAALAARGPHGSASRTIESLIDLPTLDPATAGDAKLAAVLIVAVWPSAFLTNQPGLPALLSAHLVRLSLAHGNTEESAIGYITHALTVNARSRDYRAGHAFGQLGLAVNERFDDVRLRAKAHHLFGSFLAFWGEPVAQGGRHARDAHRAALESGDFTYAARSAFMGTWYQFFSGASLPEFEAHANEVIAFLRKIHHDTIALAQQIPLQWARALRGLTSAPGRLSEGDFDEAACAAAFEKVPIFTGFLAIAQASLAYAFGDPETAYRHACNAALAARGSPENLWHPFLDFVHGLAAAGAYPRAAADARAELLARIDELCAATRIRAEACPINFEYQHLLLSAERDRILGRPTAEVKDAFARAIAAADRAGALPGRALARELAGRHDRASGDEAAARLALATAATLYEAWGATAKAQQLQRTEAPPSPASAAAEPGETSGFDAASALKAAQAIAGEIEITRLLPRLLDIVIENAGAERGVLIEASDAGLAVVADRRLGEHRPSDVSDPAVPLGAFPELPLALVTAVHAAGKPILLTEARRDAAWSHDAYLARAGVRSVLCVPLLRHALSKGVLYLENRLSADVFTEARAETVAVLASQAAISLENARLFAAMKSEVARRTQAEEGLKRALAALESSAKRLEAENVYLQEEIRTQHNFEEIVGNSAELLAALRKLERVAATDSSVLILGETGTGKELFARAIHSRSARRDRPLVKVNCAAIASGLVESELFGHVKGAFTGALQRRVGRFELADGGTLFLDEVGELPLETQAKLLRVLQEQEFEPVGTSRTQRVDVRVIAATNRDLEDAVRAGRFRADLLYRLNVFPIAVPPLRRRRDDIPLLVGFFLTGLARKLGKRLDGLARADMERLSSWSWPGNVRELENVVERAAILAEGPIARLDPIPFGRTPDDPIAPVPPAAATIVEVERAHITTVLEQAAWVVEGKAGAASILGLHPNTLRSRMKKLGITRAGAPSARSKD